MAELSQFIGEDSRAPIERLRRAQLWKIAEAMGIQYPNGAPKTAMIQLFKANNVDVTRVQGVQWCAVDGYDGDGRPRREMYPVEQPHASARNGVDANMVLTEKISVDEEKKTFEDARMDALAKDNERLKLENEALRDAMERRLAALEGKTTEPDPPKPEPEKGDYWATYRTAKELGLNPRGKKLKELEAMIEKSGG